MNTTTLVKPDASSHWYTPAGEPAYDADLRRARKEGLLPSVTGIIAESAKPALTAWLQNQAVLSALTLPRIENEPLDAFAKRAVADASTQSKKAAEFGTRVHAGCEFVALNGYLSVDFADVAAQVGHFTTWFNDNITEVVAVEKIVVHPGLGYAGKTDLIAVHKEYGLCVIDIKTQGIKEGKKATFYPEWLWQLRAYGEAYDRNTPALPNLISLVINSNKPEPVDDRVWPVEEHRVAWDAFLACLTLWKIKRKFWPGETNEQEAA